MHDSQEHIDALAEHARRWADYGRRGFSRMIDRNDKENANLTGERLNHYFQIGFDALRLICDITYRNGQHDPASILDFPCGSGRVTRHLAAMFPAAVIGGCDLYEAHVNFCAAVLGSQPIVSRENLSVLDVGSWDVIFCGSLLTHLPEPLAWQAIEFIVRSLQPGGVAIFTIEGRRTDYIQDHHYKIIRDDFYEIARAGREASGFGFVDYEHHFKADAFDKQDSYGVALIRLSWLIEHLCALEGIRIVDVIEAGWDNHQDVIAIRKNSIVA